MSEYKQSGEERWFDEIVPVHSRLTEATVQLIRTLFENNKIEYLSVDGRTKRIDSIKEKIKRKNYKTPKTQITDISGVRVIVYLESQVDPIIRIIRETFEIDEQNSLDRKQILGSDKVGYRSAHFVGALGDVRTSLPEYRDFKALKFEIQVRTVLQHAWAELAHDRSFKFSPGLPQNIQRKLNLYSGMLEVVDSAFDGIAKEIEDYKYNLTILSPAEIEEEEINRLSLDKFIQEITSQHKLKIRNNLTDEVILGELTRFGILKISDLSKIMTDEFLLDYKKTESATTGMGFLRDLMMYVDIDKYFSKSPDWGATDEDSTALLFNKYGRDKVEHLFYKNGIALVDSFDSDEEGTFQQDDDEEGISQGESEIEF